ncbi:uncharacterized protein AB9W97_007220 isoform 1-T3 [Spinachia spinachia]
MSLRVLSTEAGLGAKVYCEVCHRTVSLGEVQETASGIWAQGWRTEDLPELGSEGLEAVAGGGLTLPFGRSPQPGPPHKVVDGEGHPGLRGGKCAGLQSEEDGAVGQEGGAALWVPTVALSGSYPRFGKGPGRSQRDRSCGGCHWRTIRVSCWTWAVNAAIARSWDLADCRMSAARLVISASWCWRAPSILSKRRR